VLRDLAWTVKWQKAVLETKPSHALKAEVKMREVAHEHPHGIMSRRHKDSFTYKHCHPALSSLDHVLLASAEKMMQVMFHQA
jgi:hypothetical protein